MLSFLRGENFSRIVEGLVPAQITLSFFLVSLLSIFDNYGKLYGVDGYMLEASYWLQTSLSQSPSIEYKQPSQIFDSDEVVVITISEEMYNQDFNSRSPLDRGVISKLISEISKKSPESIFFDIDISPTEQALSHGDKELIKVIEEIPKPQNLQFSISSIGNQTVEQRMVKASWIADRCSQSNISIARPTLLESNGKIMRYYPNVGSLGLDSSKENGFCQGFNQELYWSLPGSMVSSYIKFPLVELEKEKVNFKDAEDISFVKIDSIEDIKEFSSFDGKSIFVGMEGFRTSNGVSDEFLTPIGKIPGVAIHAFQNLTQKKPVENVSGVVEVLVGVVIVVFTVVIANSRFGSLRYVIFFSAFLTLLIGFPLVMSYGYWIPPFIILLSITVDVVSYWINRISVKFPSRRSVKFLQGGLFETIFLWISAALFLFNIQSEFDDQVEKIISVFLFFILWVVYYLVVKNNSKAIK